MRNDETEIEMTMRHVRRGHAIIEQQQALVDAKRRQGRDTESSEKLLTTFEEVQDLHEQHLERLQNKEH